jgi:hypothetical protein
MDGDAALGQVVGEVEDLAEVAADPVEGVYDDRVAGPGVGRGRTDSPVCLRRSDPG